jgi:hypothetical protein
MTWCPSEDSCILGVSTTALFRASLGWVIMIWLLKPYEPRIRQALFGTHSADWLSFPTVLYFLLPVWSPLLDWSRHLFDYLSLKPESAKRGARLSVHSSGRWPLMTSGGALVQTDLTQANSQPVLGLLELICCRQEEVPSHRCQLWRSWRCWLSWDWH